MISSVLPVMSDLVVVVLWSLVFFVMGVAYAAYRAVSWVERMRAWAYSLKLEDES